MRVLNHKTVTKHGPAEFVLTKQLYSMLNNGTPMNSSIVINAMTMELSQASVSTHVTCTKPRHLGVSLVQANLAVEERLHLADLLAHSPQVAAEHYSDNIKLSWNVQSSNILSKLIRGPPPPVLEKPSCCKSYLFVLIVFVINFHIDKAKILCLMWMISLK